MDRRRVYQLTLLFREAATMIETVRRRDRLMDNFHLMEVALTSWRIPYGLSKLLLL
jgi:hypothetical protein